MSLTLLDWRREVAALYARIRAAADPADAHDDFRRTRDRLFANHPDSPLPAHARSTFAGLPYGPYDRALRFEIPVDVGIEPIEHQVQTATDGLVGFRRIGRVAVPSIGTLDVWWLLGYGGGMFLPVADPNPRTYGGGRYLLDTVKGADLGGDVDATTGRGTLVIDLNFAYNPSCAYDPAWSCPLARAGNRVPVPIDAGELTSP